jgi:hypothetical protein
LIFEWEDNKFLPFTSEKAKILEMLLVFFAICCNKYVIFCK